jgi:heme exporter protein B
MSFGKELTALLKKEFLLEFRLKHTIGGVFLYVFATIYIIYISFVKIQPNVWNTLFWIISLFVSINTVLKSFSQENSSRQLYYYQLVNPLAVITSKILYNIILIFLINLLTFIVFSLLGGAPVKDIGMFLMCILLGSIGFSITFTFITAIASKANNSSTLLAVMSFPIVIPILITLIKRSLGALRLVNDTAVLRDWTILISIDCLLFALCLILFPYLWKD